MSILRHRKMGNNFIDVIPNFSDKNEKDSIDINIPESIQKK